MKRFRAALVVGLMLALPADAAAGEIQVVASIKPIHSLVAAVMRGVGSPHLLVGGNQSPHDYSMKPSDARALEKANVVFWVGGEMERFLSRPLATLASTANVVTLSDAHGLSKLEFREGGPFEEHEEHEDHEEHGDEAGGSTKDAHDDHSRAAGSDEEDEHHDHDEKAEHGEHEHSEIDMHIWLDPLNAKALLHEIEEALGSADPANAAKYQSNASALEAALDTLVSEVTASLAQVRGRPFVVFHDAYQYFERRFGLRAVGSITVIPDVMPGAARLREIQNKVKELGAACVFAEPQFDPKLVEIVGSGVEIKTGILDPLGAGLEDGPGLYFQLIRDMSSSVKDCLS